MFPTDTDQGYDRKYHQYWLWAVLLTQVLAIFQYVYFLRQHGYLPSPFFYDKSDTFMDLFNPLQWSYSVGRYTDWHSIYPPLNFLILKWVDMGVGSGLTATVLRGQSPHMLAALFVAYLLCPLLVVRSKLWASLPVMQRTLAYFLIVLSFPMLFCLERGNLALLAPPLLAVALARTGWIRCLAIAVLINLKPYFALLLLLYAMHRQYGSLVRGVLAAGGIFVLSGCLLDEKFLLLFSNLLGFTGAKGLFSLREMMSMPSSTSAIAAVLASGSGADFARRYAGPDVISAMVYLIEASKWSVLAFAAWVGFRSAHKSSASETIALLVIMISNFGVWVGGYTLIFYMALIPVFLMQASSRYLVGIVVAMVLPWDAFTLLQEDIGPQFSYYAGHVLEVHWRLGLGSILRPLLNMALMLLMAATLLTKALPSKRALSDVDDF